MHHASYEDTLKRTDRRSDCPINFALQAFGDPWSLLILRDLMFTEARTYSDFLGADEGMATNILAARLRQLQKLGLIRKRGRGKGAHYDLTQKSLDLLPAMLGLIGWSGTYDKRTAAPRPFVARIKGDRDALERELTARLRARYNL